MAPLIVDEELVESVLQKTAQQYQSGDERILPAFDRAHGQFVLLREGWDGYKRHHYAWMHIELRNGKFWIHRDSTEQGIALDFLEAGISKDRIVLAFQHPVRRERGEFAVA